MEKKTIITNKRVEFIDITKSVQNYISNQKIVNGRVTVFIPHTTAAVTINENADPNVLDDLVKSLDNFTPHLNSFTHAEGNSQAHIRSSIFGCSQEVIVENRKLVLGIWQSIFFCEFDGPRTRSYYIST